MSKENCCNPNQKNETDSSSLKLKNDSNCDCDCDCIVETYENSTERLSTKKEFDIEIDGRSVNIADSSMNIVEVAKTVGISIPAPCFLAKKKNGCCKACVVEIDEKQSYACGIKPTRGMKIIVNREDLKTLRKERLLKYKEAIKNNEPLKCGGN